jgi:hypothetical protein
MKYIKSFNEELRPNIYKNAAYKLRQTYGHHKRADKLDAYGDELYNKQAEQRIESNRQRCSKYGTFKGKLKVRVRDGSWKIINEETIEGNFYISLFFDDDWFTDMIRESWLAEGFQYSCALPFDFDVMAADEETQKRIDESGIEQNDAMIYSNRLEMGYITRNPEQTAEGGYELIVNPKGFSFYDRDQNSDFNFSTRTEALKFKKLFVGAILGENDFAVDHNWVKHPNLKEHIEAALQRQNCVTDDGFSLINPEEDLIKLQNSARLMSLNILYKE